MKRTSNSIAEAVSSGLCIGCGLCEAVTNGRMEMVMTEYGSLRPTPTNGLTPDEENILLAACPGSVAKPRPQPGTMVDEIWGAYSSMRYAWAGNPEVRFRSATGGTLTALGMHLLETGEVAFVLHVCADPESPMRSKWVMSETPEEVFQCCGSRYGPTAPLAGLVKALDRDLPFAIIAKPCDLGAVHALSRNDPRVDKLCVLRLAMVCGGQSRLRKSQALLTELGVQEDNLTLFRYRGYGNPGLTRIETRDGATFQRTYQELWEDEGTWELETRCKICPDALGEASDIAAADVWPGGSPSGEDDGFNGIIVRSPLGEEVVREAVEAGNLVLGKPIAAHEFDAFQPHQVRKKHAVVARLDGMAEAGLPVIDAIGLRLQKLADNLSPEEYERQREGIRKRIQEGRVTEPIPE